MCPEPRILLTKSPIQPFPFADGCPILSRPHRQRGAMLMLALFMIVVIGLLAAVLSEILQKSATTVSYEVLGVRAHAAASSGLEAGLYEVLRQSKTCSEVATDESTLSTALSVNLDTAQTALSQCTVTVTCGHLPVLSGDTQTYYLVRSEGNCTGSNFHVRRVMRAEVRK